MLHDLHNILALFNNFRLFNNNFFNLEFFCYRFLLNYDIFLYLLYNLDLLLRTIIWFLNHNLHSRLLLCNILYLPLLLYLFIIKLIFFNRMIYLLCLLSHLHILLKNLALVPFRLLHINLYRLRISNILDLFLDSLLSSLLYMLGLANLTLYISKSIMNLVINLSLDIYFLFLLDLVLNVRNRRFLNHCLLIHCFSYILYFLLLTQSIVILMLLSVIVDCILYLL